MATARDMLIILLYGSFFKSVRKLYNMRQPRAQRDNILLPSPNGPNIFTSKSTHYSKLFFYNIVLFSENFLPLLL